jgi:hypothetical protein
MKKKIHFGKKTLMSLEFQITTILTHLNRTDVQIDKMKPVRHNTGNFVIVTYHTIPEPKVPRSRYFAHQKIGNCCDVWLETPAEVADVPQGGNAA